MRINTKILFMVSGLLIATGVFFCNTPQVFAQQNEPLSHLRVLQRTSTSLTILWDSPLRSAFSLSTATKANPRTHRITVIDEKTGETIQRLATSQGIITIRNLKKDHDYVIRVRGGYEAKNKPALTKRLTTTRVQ